MYVHYMPLCLFFSWPRMRWVNAKGFYLLNDLSTLMSLRTLLLFSKSYLANIETCDGGLNSHNQRNKNN